MLVWGMDAVHNWKRFWSKVHITEDGCWEWTGCLFKKGYGCFGKNSYAHRVAWILIHGSEIPAGKQICHSCDNRKCVRVSHLFLGSAKDNTQDMIAKGRDKGVCAEQRKKTHCHKGHELVGDNLKIAKNGARICRTCGNETRRLWAKNHPEKRKEILQRYSAKCKVANLPRAA